MKHLNRSNQGWVAVADLGSNTFQLLIGRVRAGWLETAFRYKTGVQIGKGGMTLKTILPEAIERAVAVLQHFRSILGEYGLTEKDCIVLGTSAFRNADNQKEVIDKILNETGFVVQVISGDLEAELIFKGVIASGIIENKETALIIDIGGGSVEFILCEGKKQLWRQSFEIGGLRLLEKFHKTDPILSTEIEALFAYLDPKLAPLKEILKSSKPGILIGCSGTFDTLVEIDQKLKNERFEEVGSQPKYHLPQADFEFLSQKIIAANRAERLAIPGMIELRVDMIVVAVLLTQYVLSLMKNPEIRVSTFALKEGAFFHDFAET